MAPGEHKSTVQAGVAAVGGDGQQRAVAFAQRTWTAPIPPIEYLERIEKVCPGSADRLIQMAERQAVHRQGLESENSRRESTDTVQLWQVARRGQANSMWMAFAGLAAAAIVAIWAPGPAAWIVPSSIMVAVFGYFTYAQVQAGRAVAPDDEEDEEREEASLAPAPELAPPSRAGDRAEKVAGKS